MKRTYSQTHRRDKYSQFTSIFLSVWLKGGVFVYALSGCGFEFRCCNLNFRCRESFELGVP